jgi:hypothetical protein
LGSALEPKYDESHSTFAFNFNLRRCTVGQRAATEAARVAATEAARAATEAARVADEVRPTAAAAAAAAENERLLPVAAAAAEAECVAAELQPAAAAADAAAQAERLVAVAAAALEAYAEQPSTPAEQTPRDSGDSARIPSANHPARGGEPKDLKILELQNENKVGPCKLKPILILPVTESWQDFETPLSIPPCAPTTRTSVTASRSVAMQGGY